MSGTFINVGTVVVGCLIGVTIGARLPEQMRNTVLNGLGLVTSLVGVQMALGTTNILIALGALLLGAVCGELLRLEEMLQRLGQWLQAKFSSGGRSTFAEGFVTASLVFCIGPMAILGSIQDGLSGDYKVLAVKSLLDGFASIAFSASLGWGVALSVVPLFLYQGSITLFAGILCQLLSEPMIAEMTATGGLIIVGIGLKLLRIKELRLASFLPALAIAPLIVVLIPWVKSLF
jgi:uncharacterized protein